MDLFFPFLGDWVWFVAAGILLFLELMLPGVFFIWLAIAALATGVADRIAGLGWQGELLAFAAFGLVSIFAGRALMNKQHVLDSDKPNLNQRMYDYVGKTYVLNQPIVNGMGRIKIDDTLWDVLGPDLPSGAHVKVTGVDGLRLMVAAV